MSEDDVMNMKDILRKSILKKRNALSASEVLEKSTRIKKRIFEMELFKNAQNILFYVSYGNEVYTHNMIKESFMLGKRVVVPKSISDDNSLTLSILNNWNNLELGEYNILEPRKDSIEEIDIGSIDLIIVPGVVFDKEGNRIGHGKGYYDRLLKDYQDIPTIGLAFGFQIVEYIISEKHDKKIDIIITEDRIIK
jgi:5-formyltetrahydrofolate cyclo-ligase